MSTQIGCCLKLALRKKKQCCHGCGMKKWEAERKSNLTELQFVFGSSNILNVLMKPTIIKTSVQNTLHQKITTKKQKHFGVCWLCLLLQTQSELPPAKTHFFATLTQSCVIFLTWHGKQLLIYTFSNNKAKICTKVFDQSEWDEEVL